MTDAREEEIRAAATGNARALDSLFERCMMPLVGFIRARLGPAVSARESATDLAQSVFREVLQDFDAVEYRGETAFRGWLYQQAVRKILDRNRYYHRARRDVAREARGSREDDFDALAGCYASLCTPSRHAAAREEVERFENAVASLPDAQRDAVTMSRIMNLGYKEIAQIMGISESAVRGLVARGLSALSAKLVPDRGGS